MTFFIKTLFFPLVPSNNMWSFHLKKGARLLIIWGFKVLGGVLSGGSLRGDLWGCGGALVGRGTGGARVLRTPRRSQSCFSLPVSHRQFIFGFERQRHKAICIGHQDNPQRTCRTHTIISLIKHHIRKEWQQGGVSTVKTLRLLRVISCLYFKPCNLASRLLSTSNFNP